MIPTIQILTIVGSTAPRADVPDINVGLRAAGRYVPQWDYMAQPEEDIPVHMQLWVQKETLRFKHTTVRYVQSYITGPGGEYTYAYSRTKPFYTAVPWSNRDDITFRWYRPIA